MGTRKLLIINDEIHSDGMALLRQKLRVVVDPAMGALSGEIEIADALLVRSSGEIRMSLLDGARNLKVIGRYGAGVDNIDVALCSKRGIPIVYAPGVNAKSVAEMVMGQAIALRRNSSAQDAMVRRGDWTGRDRLAGDDIRGSTIGLIGLGLIGLEVTRIARNGFAMNVLYFDQVRNSMAEEEFGAFLVGLDELLNKSDIVSLHVPYTPATHHLIGMRELRLMKQSAILLNFARGGIIDEAALADALLSGRIAGAALDVFMNEPPTIDAELFRAPNTLFSMHTAGISAGASRDISMTVASDILAVLSGQNPRHVYNFSAQSDFSSVSGLARGKDG
jgi:D-3-phosphoglycerate dehydrogenase